MAFFWSCITGILPAGSILIPVHYAGKRPKEPWSTGSSLYRTARPYSGCCSGLNETLKKAKTGIRKRPDARPGMKKMKSVCRLSQFIPLSALAVDNVPHDTKDHDNNHCDDDERSSREFWQGKTKTLTELLLKSKGIIVGLVPFG